MVDLTNGQKRVLRAILRFARSAGRMPTIRELCAVLGISSPNGVNGHLRALEVKGYLVPSDEQKARALQIPGVKMELRFLESSRGQELREIMEASEDGCTRHGAAETVTAGSTVEGVD